jgi:hypothetical protein
VTATKDYWLYGLRVRSEVDLPELPPARGDGDPDVAISLGAVQLEANTSAMHAAPDGARFAISGTARYLICDGATIVVDPEQGAPERNVRLYLLGSAMGMLVHQRGLLPLHANTILIGGKAIAFMGHSGAGKSTLAAWFYDLGHVVLGDDVCVVRVDRGRPAVSAGLPRLRLWKNTIEASGREVADYPLSYMGTEGLEKYDVKLDRLPPEDEVELVALYELFRGETFDIQPMPPVAAMESIFANTYRGEYIELTGTARSHWEACVSVARQVPVFRLERPWDLDQGAQLAERIVEHLLRATAAHASDS